VHGRECVIHHFEIKAALRSLEANGTRQVRGRTVAVADTATSHTAASTTANSEAADATAAAAAINTTSATAVC
jgi:hypothetical protein